LKSRIPARANPLSLLVEILDWLLAPLIILWPLSVVVTFAAQHRASVQVRPNPAERGSVFTVIFPRLPVVPQRAAA